jgi:hypothetical protein
MKSERMVRASVPDFMTLLHAPSTRVLAIDGSEL